MAGSILPGKGNGAKSIRIQCLRFGVPDLDILLGSSPRDDAQPEGLYYGQGTTSLCLIGPDGSGKTVLALHLAARYLRDARLLATIPGVDARRRGDGAKTSARFDPKLGAPAIIYASVDLSLQKAKETWEHFSLDCLAARDRTLYIPDGWQDDPKLHLLAPAPDDDQLASLRELETDEQLIEFCATAGTSGKVGFLDLHPKAAGDPWNYLRRVTALLASAATARDEKQRPSSMLLVDSIEALYTLSGTIDAYGEARTRESRVSQLLDAARRGNTHVVLLVGAGEDDDRPREAYLTDSVIRLRVSEQAGYYSRTVEVEKVRAQSSVRGRHRFSIRSGDGSTTGRQIDPDDPRVAISRKAGETPSVKAYVRVFHSIDFLDSFERSVRDESRKTQSGSQRAENREERVARSRFTGIEFLDTLIPSALKDSDLCRLEPGTVTSLIGAAKTFKSNIARAFLACGVFDPILPPERRAEDRQVSTLGAVARYVIERNSRATFEGATAEGPGIGVLLTSDDIRPDEAAELLREWLHLPEKLGEGQQVTSDEILEWIESRIICRRLEAHTVYPEGLIHIVLRCIYEARRRLGISGADTPENRRRSGQIRLVIDDWSSICQMYPAVNADSKCLQFLLREIRRLGVTALVTNSQTLSRGELLSAGGGDNLAAVSDVVFTTWPVAFRGRRLAAICVGEPGRNVEATIVREIRHRSNERERLIVDPRLEMYRGLFREEVEPEPVPLRVLLLDEAHAGKEYLEATRQLFGELFAPLPGVHSVVETLPLELNLHAKYEQLRSLCYFQTGSLNHTLVLLVDEFWSIESHSAFRMLRDYFDAETDHRDREYRLLLDPHELFRSRLREPEVAASIPGANGYRTRKSFFDLGLFQGPQLPSAWYPGRTTLISSALVAAPPSAVSGFGPTDASSAGELSGRDAEVTAVQGSSPETPRSATEPAGPVMSEQATKAQDEQDAAVSIAPTLEARGGPDPAGPEEDRACQDDPVAVSFSSNTTAADDNPDQRGMLRDRVPYSWDFMFLTCRIRAWENARTRWVKAWDAGEGRSIERSVSQVWDALDGGANPLLPGIVKPVQGAKTGGKPGEEAAPAGQDQTVRPASRDSTEASDQGRPSPDLRSWRWFLGAAQVVAQSDNLLTAKRVIPFDFHAAGPETFGCWVLEVWASEIWRSIQRDRSATGEAYRKRAKAFEDWMLAGPEFREPQGLLDWLGVEPETGDASELGGVFCLLAEGEPDTNVPFDEIRASVGWCVELYKSLRLISDFVFELDWFVPSHMGSTPPRVPAPGAVAVRDFYKTAAARVDTYDDGDPTVVVRLPGNFSTRGDLALAVANESRSARLGERAIDKLCSRSANHQRLTTGIGLPVRTMAEEERAALLTRLLTVERYWEPATSNPHDFYPPVYVRPLLYSELLWAAPGAREEECFCWLWRSRLAHYDSQSAVWQRWLHSVMDYFFRLRKARGVAWIPSLEAYDVVDRWQCGVAPDPNAAIEGRPPNLTTFRRDFGARCLSLIAQLQAAAPGE